MQRHNDRIIIGVGIARQVGHRVARRIVSADQGLVLDLPRIDIRNGNLIAGGECGTVHSAGCQAGNRTATDHDSGQRIGQGHVGQGRVARVCHRKAVGDGFPDNRRIGQCAVISNLDQGKARVLRNDGRCRRVISGVGAGLVRHHIAKRIGALHRGLVDHLPRVDIGLCDLVGRGKRRAVGCTGRKTGNRSADQGKAGQRIADGDIGQGDITGVGYCKAVGNRVTNRGRCRKGRGIGGFHQCNRGIVNRCNRGHIVFATLVCVAVSVRIGVGAVVGQIRQHRIGGRRLARQHTFAGNGCLVFIPATRGLDRRERHGGLHPQGNIDLAGCAGGKGCAAGQRYTAGPVEPAVQAATCARGNRQNGVIPGRHCVGRRIAQCNIGAVSRCGAGHLVGYRNVVQVFQTQVLDNHAIGHIERPVGIGCRSGDHGFRDTDAGCGHNGKQIVGGRHISAKRDIGNRIRSRGRAAGGAGGVGAVCKVRLGRSAACDGVIAFGQQVEAVAAIRGCGDGAVYRVTVLVGAGQCDGYATHAGITGLGCAVVVEIAIQLAADGRSVDCNRAGIAVVCRNRVQRRCADRGRVGKHLPLRSDRGHLNRHGNLYHAAAGKCAKITTERGPPCRACTGGRGYIAGTGSHRRGTCQNHIGRQAVGDRYIVGLGQSGTGTGIVAHLDDKGEVVQHVGRIRGSNLADHLDVGFGADGGGLGC